MNIRIRVQGHAGLDPTVHDLPDQLVAVAPVCDLDMKREQIRARIQEGIRVAPGVVDHQVDVQRTAGHLLDRSHHRRSEGQVGHEVPVHHVQVQPIGPGLLDPAHLFSETGKVCGQQRWGNTDRVRGLQRLNGI